MENNQELENYDDEKKLVLAVDDEESILDLLQFNIEKEGFRFSSAADGKEGFEKIVAEKPDLVILDLMLPKMDG